jgi:hypothetical protein
MSRRYNTSQPDRLHGGSETTSATGILLLKQYSIAKERTDLGVQVGQKLQANYGSRSFITVFARTRARPAVAIS